MIVLAISPWVARLRATEMKPYWSFWAGRIPLEPMRLTMPFDWETFPQWMDHVDRLPKGINMIQLVPVTPLVSYVMGGWNEAKARQPNEKEMAEILRLFQQLNREEGITIIIVTHDAAVAGHAKRIIHIKDGLIEGDDGAPPRREALAAAA